jgi:hypothetical protein
MSKLHSLKQQAGSIKKLPAQLFSRLKDSLTSFLERQSFELVYIVLAIHDNQILKVIRTHVTIFDMGGRTLQGADPINIELRRRLNHLIQFLENDYGFLKIIIEDGRITKVQPAPMYSLKDFDFEE